MLGSANIFQSDPNVLAAFTGKGSPNLIAPTYAATMTIDPAAGEYQQLTLTGDATLNALTPGLPGQSLILEIAASGGTRTATFGTSFRKTGTAAPTTGTIILVWFRSNGTTWNEVSRSASALAAI